MDVKEFIHAGVFALVLTGLASVSNIEIGDPDEEAAVAAAVKSEFEMWLGADTLAGKGEAVGRLVLCLESNGTLNIERIADHLSGTIVEPVSSSDCTTEIEEGDFGILTTLTHYFGPDGEDAAHLEIAKVSCRNTSVCDVDIDRRGGGSTYRMERQGKVWETTANWVRWII